MKGKAKMKSPSSSSSSPLSQPSSSPAGDGERRAGVPRHALASPSQDKGTPRDKGKASSNNNNNNNENEEVDVHERLYRLSFLPPRQHCSPSHHHGHEHHHHHHHHHHPESATPSPRLRRRRQQQTDHQLSNDRGKRAGNPIHTPPRPLNNTLETRSKHASESRGEQENPTHDAKKTASPSSSAATAAADFSNWHHLYSHQDNIHDLRSKTERMDSMDSLVTHIDGKTNTDADEDDDDEKENQEQGREDKKEEESTDDWNDAYSDSILSSTLSVSNMVQHYRCHNCNRLLDRNNPTEHDAIDDTNDKNNDCTFSPDIRQSQRIVPSPATTATATTPVGDSDYSWNNNSNEEEVVGGGSVFSRLYHDFERRERKCKERHLASLEDWDCTFQPRTNVHRNVGGGGGGRRRPRYHHAGGVSTMASLTAGKAVSVASTTATTTEKDDDDVEEATITTIATMDRMRKESNASLEDSLVGTEFVPRNGSVGGGSERRQQQQQQYHHRVLCRECSSNLLGMEKSPNALLGDDDVGIDVGDDDVDVDMDDVRKEEIEKEEEVVMAKVEVGEHERDAERQREKEPELEKTILTDEGESADHERLEGHNTFRSFEDSSLLVGNEENIQLKDDVLEQLKVVVHDDTEAFLENEGTMKKNEVSSSEENREKVLAEAVRDVGCDEDNKKINKVATEDDPKKVVSETVRDVFCDKDNKRKNKTKPEEDLEVVTETARDVVGDKENKENDVESEEDLEKAVDVVCDEDNSNEEATHEEDLRKCVSETARDVFCDEDNVKEEAANKEDPEKATTETASDVVCDEDNKNEKAADEEDLEKTETETVKHSKPPLPVQPEDVHRLALRSLSRTVTAHDNSHELEEKAEGNIRGKGVLINSSDVKRVASRDSLVSTRSSELSMISELETYESNDMLFEQSSLVLLGRWDDDDIDIDNDDTEVLQKIDGTIADLKAMIELHDAADSSKAHQDLDSSFDVVDLLSAAEKSRSLKLEQVGAKSKPDGSDADINETEVKQLPFELQSETTNEENVDRTEENEEFKALSGTDSRPKSPQVSLLRNLDLSDPSSKPNETSSPVTENAAAEEALVDREVDKIRACAAVMLFVGASATGAIAGGVIRVFGVVVLCYLSTVPLPTAAEDAPHARASLDGSYSQRRHPEALNRQSYVGAVRGFLVKLVCCRKLALLVMYIIAWIYICDAISAVWTISSRQSASYMRSKYFVQREPHVRTTDSADMEIAAVSSTFEANEVNRSTSAQSFDISQKNHEQIHNVRVSTSDVSMKCGCSQCKRNPTILMRQNAPIVLRPLGGSCFHTRSITEKDLPVVSKKSLMLNTESHPLCHEPSDIFQEISDDVVTDTDDISLSTSQRQESLISSRGAKRSLKSLIRWVTAPLRKCVGFLLGKKSEKNAWMLEILAGIWIDPHSLN